MLKNAFWILMLLCPGAALAEARAFTLHAPAALVDSGLMRYLLPRFSLKTGIHITLGGAGAQARFGTQGRPVFRSGDITWHFSYDAGALPARFEEWLLSDIGKRTIEGFAPGGTPLYSADVAALVEETQEVFTGDAALGAQISLSRCGRCHVVGEVNRMNAIGSTPSFALLRNFDDWRERFEIFYVLKPHPAFTQVAEVTEPFPETLPSPIAPLELTLDELDAIIAFAAQIAPADLGAPIQSR